MTSPNENYTSWHVGMRVVCVDDGPSRVRDIHLGLRAGAIYTIREVGRLIEDAVISVRLDEISNPPWESGKEGAFAADRFRPVVTRPTSIAIFHSILSNPRKKLHTEDA